MGHALTAYLGDLRGDTYIYESIGRPETELCALRAMTQSAMALSAKYGAPFPELNAHVEDLICRFGNRRLGDTVERVGRDLRRKLSPDDRIVGALRLCDAAGIPSSYVARGLAAALRFSKDPLTREMPRRQILSEICGIDPESAQGRAIMALADADAGADADAYADADADAGAGAGATDAGADAARSR
jgi:mannitol-1-phosphate 5-dehydrogenase